MAPRRLPDRHGTKRDRFARLVRVLMVLNARQEEGISVDALAAATDVSRRQAYRDLHALEDETETPLWNDRGRWGLMQSALLPSLSLTIDEAMAFFVAARLLAKAIDEQDADFTSAFLKLAAVLPPRLHQHVIDALDQLSAGRDDPEFRRSVQVLSEAWIDGRVVQFEYDAGAYDGGSVARETRRVRPYLIEPSALTRGLYLVGHDEERDATRTFKIERIRNVSVTPRRFEPPERYRAGSVLAAAWDVIGDQEPIDVVLRFRPSVAARVAETRWHRSQAIEPQRDGSLIWRATVAGPLEIGIWILGWGDEVEVLEPPDLRARIGGQLGRAAALYRDAGQDATRGPQSDGDTRNAAGRHQTGRPGRASTKGKIR
jgi:predicted DNA-binding transcriptional regulator YafY